MENTKCLSRKLIAGTHGKIIGGATDPLLAKGGMEGWPFQYGLNGSPHPAAIQ